MNSIRSHLCTCRAACVNGGLILGFIVFAVHFATLATASGQGGEDKVRPLSPWETELVVQITTLNPDELTPLKYRKFRAACIELSTCNRPRFKSILKNMLLETPLLKDNPKFEPLLDRSHEYNLTLMLAMVSVHNGIPLDEVQMLDLQARSMGVSSSAKDKAEVAMIVQVCKAIEAENQKLK